MSQDQYTPPFTISADTLRFRRICRAKSIYATLAIEGNTLSERQVLALAEEYDIQAYIRENPGCRANEIAEALFIPFRSVQRHISVLRKQKEIEFRGAPKNGGYYVTGAKP